MSWIAKGEAITVNDTTPSGTYGPFAAESATVTSTSTILQSSGTNYSFRLFGVDAGQFGSLPVGSPNSFTVNTTTPTSDWVTKYTAAGATIEYHQYVESPSWTYGNFPEVIALDKYTTPFYETNVPRTLKGHAVTWYQLSDTGAAGLGKVVATKQTAAAGVINELIKDVHVVEVPNGGGWLLVAARYLYDAATSMGDVNPETSMGQIIAWWSPNEDFTSPIVIGPFLLVDGAHCMSHDQPVRLWVGVPGLAFAPDGAGDYDMFVYYAVETCGLGYKNTASSAGAAGLVDNVSDVMYALGIATMAFSPCVAVKRIALAELQEASSDDVTGVATSTDEAAWTPRAALSGDLLGEVRFWIVDPSWDFKALLIEVLSFFSVYSIFDVRFADPVPATCPSGSLILSLYLAANQVEGSALTPKGADSAARTLGTGHGIWRGRAVSDGAPLVSRSAGTSIVATYGKDFVVAPIAAGTTYKSPDQVAESVGTTILLDPDVCQLETGEWWVAAGAATSHPITGYLGDFGDGCASWERAFVDRGSIYPLSSSAPAVGSFPDLPTNHDGGLDGHI